MVRTAERSKEVGVLALGYRQPVLHVLGVVGIARQPVGWAGSRQQRAIERLGIHARERLLAEPGDDRHLLIDAELLDDAHHARQVGTCFRDLQHLNASIGGNPGHVWRHVCLAQRNGNLDG